MKMLMHVMLIAALACGLTACGNKGKLKTPTQAKMEEAKKAKKAAEKKEKELKESPQAVPPAETQ